MGCSLDRCLKKRAGNSLLHSIQTLLISLTGTDTDVSDALVLHNSLYIGKVKIDQSRHIDQVSDTLNTLLKNLICLLKCILHGSSAVNDL